MDDTLKGLLIALLCAAVPLIVAYFKAWGIERQAKAEKALKAVTAPLPQTAPLEISGALTSVIDDYKKEINELKATTQAKADLVLVLQERERSLRMEIEAHILRINLIADELAEANVEIERLRSSEKKGS